MVLGDATVTTAAMRWCKATNVAVAILDPDLKMVLSSATGVEDARIRRQQATAPTNEIGLAIAKTLLGAKLQGEARIARTTLLRRQAADDIESFLTALADADGLDACRSLEAAAAEPYWGCWSDDPATALRFARTDVSRGRIPEHWRRFDARRSFLGAGNSNRRAERPLNALLNLGYRLAEVEVRLQCLAIGVEPSSVSSTWTEPVVTAWSSTSWKWLGRQSRHMYSASSNSGPFGDPISNRLPMGRCGLRWRPRAGHAAPGPGNGRILLDRQGARRESGHTVDGDTRQLENGSPTVGSIFLKFRVYVAQPALRIWALEGDNNLVAASNLLRLN